MVPDRLPFDQIVGMVQRRTPRSPPHPPAHPCPLDEDRVGSVAPVPVVAWGNALRPVVETTSTPTFGKRTNPAFRAICAELDRRNAPEGPSFVIRPARTRAERTKGRVDLSRSTGARPLNRLRHRAMLFFFLGGLAWPVRLTSWIVVAALAAGITLARPAGDRGERVGAARRDAVVVAWPAPRATRRCGSGGSAGAEDEPRGLIVRGIVARGDAPSARPAAPSGEGPGTAGRRHAPAGALAQPRSDDVADRGAR